jgi:hypothetical protein
MVSEGYSGKAQNLKEIALKLEVDCHGEILVSEVYSGIGIKHEEVLVGACARDNTLELITTVNNRTRYFRVDPETGDILEFPN